MKDSQKFLSVVLGTGLMVLCCAAPIALVLFGTAGLAALAGYLDYLLFAARVKLKSCVWREVERVTYPAD